MQENKNLKKKKTWIVINEVLATYYESIQGMYRTCDNASCSAEGIFLSASCAASLSCKIFAKP